MEKKEIRQLYKQKRLELTDLEIHEKSTLICEQFFSNFSVAGKTISLFLPIQRHNEINTYLILDKLIELNIRIGLPKTIIENNTIVHILYLSKEQLSINSYGIPEPMQGDLLNDKQFDIVLIPLLAFDNSGHRVGYGKGYYDRFLKNCSPQCLFIGLSTFNETVMIDDLNSHDIPLDFVITPSKIYHFGNK